MYIFYLIPLILTPYIFFKLIKRFFGNTKQINLKQSYLNNPKQKREGLLEYQKFMTNWNKKNRKLA
jgi:hypothetical protein